MELPPSNKYLARQDAEIADAERESLSKRLADEFAAGRFTQDEYLSTLEALYEAKTMGELAPIAAKLPQPTADVPTIVGVGSGNPGELAPIKQMDAAKLIKIVGGLATMLAVLIVLAVLL